MLFPFFEPDEPQPEPDKASSPSESVESGVSSSVGGAHEEEQDSSTDEVNLFNLCHIMWKFCLKR